MLPTTPQTGGNALVVESHLHFPHHYSNNNPPPRPLEQNQSSSSSSISLPSEDELFYKKRLEELKGDDWMEIDPHDSVVLQPEKILTCLLDAGDLLLWDSRTVHCSYPPPKAAGQKPAHASFHDISTNKQGKEAGMVSGWTKKSQRHTLIRAATTVTMMPAVDIPIRVLEERRHCCSYSMEQNATSSSSPPLSLPFRTLTHWVNKVQPLGEERPEIVAKERERIQAMLEWQEQQQKRILLDFDRDLTLEQQKLVVGTEEGV